MEYKAELLIDKTSTGVIFKFRGDNLNLSPEASYRSNFIEYSDSEAFDYGLKDPDKIEHLINHNKLMNDTTTLDAVKVLEDSIDLFFYFKDAYARKIIFSTKLSGEFKKKYWKLGAPDLYVAYVNNIGKVVDLTQRAWEVVECYRLLETYYNKTYVVGVFDHKDRIIENLNTLVIDYEDTIIAKEILAYIKSTDLTENEVEIMKEEVIDYEERLQNIIDNNEERILNSVQEYRGKSGDEIFKTVGLDAGFVNIYPIREDITNKLRLLSNRGETKWLDLSFPFMSQSTTIMKKQAYELNEILKEKGMEELTISSRLD